MIDEGIGMKPEQLARLFGEFEQVDDSEGIERGGSGLGLAISRHLIQRMGGDIEVQSRFGHGSTFTISLQLEASIFASPMALLPLDQLQSSPPVCKEYPVRALVVDDQPINLKLASLLLEKLGCEVKQAADGREAIDHCETNQFDIIFMDIRMPILSGLEAAMLITQTPGINQHTPIVALTACAFDEDRQASLEAGMLDHLPKPLRRAQLEQALKTFVSPRSQEQLRKASE